MTAPFPTRGQEEWRYADLDALKPVWEQLAEPLRRVFAELYRPTEDLSVDVHPDSKYFIRGITYESKVKPWIDRIVYGPIVSLVARGADAIRSVQSGSVHLYLAYLCAALLLLLLAARWLP